MRLLSRNGKDRTGNLPRIAEAIRLLSPVTLLLDGEVVAFDRKGVSRFQFLQQDKGEPVHAVFDCLFRQGEDLRRDPLSARRRDGRSIGSNKVLLPSNISRLSKRRSAGDTRDWSRKIFPPHMWKGGQPKWLKVKVHQQEDELVIVGYSELAGSRQHFGTLLLGAYYNGRLRYVGKVRTGFNRKTLAALWHKFQPLLSRQPALVGAPRGKGAIFLALRLIVQISFREWTSPFKQVLCPTE